jgi:hypothetical protein
MTPGYYKKEDHMKIAYFTDTYSPEINGVTNTLSRLGVYLDDQLWRISALF